MNIRRFSSLLVIFYFASFGIASAQSTVIDNSGFVPGNLWFSKTPTTVGEVVQVYTLVWNGSNDDITGNVSFFDNDSVISKQQFILAGAGSTKILSAPWTAGEGYHKIYAEITDSVGGPRGSKAVSVSLQYAKTVEEEHFVNAPTGPVTAVTGAASNFVDQKVGYATGYLEANLPGPVVNATKTVAGSIESARASAKAWSEQKINSLRNDVASTTAKDAQGKTATKTGDTGFNIEGPFRYAAIALLSAGDYILGNGWLFYGSGLIIILFVLRFIKRKFFF